MTVVSESNPSNLGEDKCQRYQYSFVRTIPSLFLVTLTRNENLIVESELKMRGITSKIVQNFVRLSRLSPDKAGNRLLLFFRSVNLDCADYCTRRLCYKTVVYMQNLRLYTTLSYIALVRPVHVH